MLITSYHNKAKDGDICISSSIPKWQSKYLIHYKKLSPFSVIDYHNPLKMSNEFYIHAFKEGLKKLNPRQIYDELLKLSNGNEPCIICYEKPTDLCHRHLLAVWFNEKLGIEFKERDLQEGFILNKEKGLYEKVKQEPCKERSLF